MHAAVTIPELVDNILDFLLLEERKDTGVRNLRGSSLVCKLWAESAARHMFPRITLHSDVRTYVPPGSCKDTCESPWWLLRSPRVANNVQCLALTGYVTGHLAVDGVLPGVQTGHDVPVGTVIDIMRMLPRVRTLCLYTCFVPEPGPQIAPCPPHGPFTLAPALELDRLIIYTHNYGFDGTAQAIHILLGTLSDVGTLDIEHAHFVDLYLDGKILEQANARTDETTSLDHDCPFTTCTVRSVIFRGVNKRLSQQWCKALSAVTDTQKVESLYLYRSLQGGDTSGFNSLTETHGQNMRTLYLTHEMSDPVPEFEEATTGTCSAYQVKICPHQTSPSETGFCATPE